MLRRAWPSELHSQCPAPSANRRRYPALGGTGGGVPAGLADRRGGFGGPESQGFPARFPGRAAGAEGKRQPCGLLREAQSDPKVGSETSGGRGQRPPRRLSDRGKPGDTNTYWRGTKGSVCPVGTCHRRWQSDPKESTETSGGRGQRPSRRLRLRTCGPSKPPEKVLSAV